EDQILLPHRGRTLDAHLLGDGREVGDLLVLERLQVERRRLVTGGAAIARGRRRSVGLRGCGRRGGGLAGPREMLFSRSFPRTQRTPLPTPKALRRISMTSLGLFQSRERSPGGTTVASLRNVNLWWGTR